LFVRDLPLDVSDPIRADPAAPLESASFGRVLGFVAIGALIVLFRRARRR